MSPEYYTRSFYEGHRSGSTQSAEVVVPLVLGLLTVRSVVDVGCGDGSWLSVFRKLGVDDILGIDGEYVTPDLLQIPPDYFRAVDLAKPFAMDRVFDLAVSLEVAEHLPPDCASVFIESLTRLAPLVLFSAAIPSQGGNHHINEQWPDKWAGLFRNHGYFPVDFVRKRVWQNESVDWWYAQNTILFVAGSFLESNPSLRTEFEQTNLSQICLVHPRQYLYLASRYVEASARAQRLTVSPGVKAASKLFFVTLVNSIRRRIYSILGKEKLL